MVLLCGMPGAGKSTAARRHAADLGAVRLCPDEWLLALGLDPLDAAAHLRVERLLWEHGLALVARGIPLVVDFGSWTRLRRRRMAEQARAAGAEVVLHLLDVALAERWRRVERRNAEPGAVVVTYEQLAAPERWWEPPDAAELAGYDQVWS